MAQKLGLSCWRLHAIESGNTRGASFSPELIRRTLALYAKKLGLSPSLANPYGSTPKPDRSLAFSQTPVSLRHPAIAAGADCALLVAKRNSQPSPAEQ
jgi:hypothetical protein